MIVTILGSSTANLGSSGQCAGGLAKKKTWPYTCWKTRKVKPCLQVFSIIRSEYLECNIRRRFFGQDDLLWRCSSQYAEVPELSISPSHPIRPDAEGLQDASCRSPQGRTGREYPAALLQRLRINQATTPCICRAEKALHKIAGTLCS